MVKYAKRIQKYFVTVRFWDMVENNWITLTMYPGDRTADVFKYDKTGRPVDVHKLQSQHY